MTAAYTIVTLNYLSNAKTLADSLTAFNPDVEFYICLIGNKKDIPDITFFSAYSIIDTASSVIPEFAEMRQRYVNFELSCALKPFFAGVLFSNYNAESLFYFDSDILVFNSLTIARQALTQNSIVITPHCTEVIDRNDGNQMDLIILNYGLYNAGFFGVRRSKIAFAFIDWWKDKMKTECLVDLANGRFVDQIWLNLVPVYFNEVQVVKDLGYNMAAWNMSERKVSIKNGCFIVNNESPLVFFHFSGYSIAAPEILSKNHNTFSFQERPDVVPVFKEYSDKLKQNKIEFYASLNSGENYNATSVVKNKKPGLLSRIYRCLKG